MAEGAAVAVASFAATWRPVMGLWSGTGEEGGVDMVMDGGVKGQRRWETLLKPLPNQHRRRVGWMYGYR